jgi:hypothetical protein
MERRWAGMSTRSAELSRPSSITTVYGREASWSCAVYTLGEGVVNTAIAMRNRPATKQGRRILRPFYDIS